MHDGASTEAEGLRRKIRALKAGMVACVGVVFLALICGPIRGIPLYWRLIDCSFGIVAFPILCWTAKLTGRLEKLSSR